MRRAVNSSTAVTHGDEPPIWLLLPAKIFCSAPMIAPHVNDDSGPMVSLKEMMSTRELAFFVARAAMMP